MNPTHALKPGSDVACWEDPRQALAGRVHSPALSSAFYCGVLQVELPVCLLLAPPQDQKHYEVKGDLQPLCLPSMVPDNQHILFNELRKENRNK